jgi:predicted ArsR family transcriptional regulator
VSLRTRVLPDQVPAPVRRAAIRSLFRATADAFGASMPDLRGRSADAMLAAYARYTDELARAVLNDPDRRPLVERRLHANMERIGRRVRRYLGVRTTPEALEVARRLYRLIGIDLTGSGRGEVVVTHCSFASVYSPEVCSLMSASDAGLLAGLTGGRELAFTERLTSGAPACLATLTPAGGHGR